MNDSSPPLVSTCPARATFLIALAVGIAVTSSILAYPLSATPSSSAMPDAHVRSIPITLAMMARQIDDSQSPPRDLLPPADMPLGNHEGEPGEADGALPEGVTIFEDGYPGVANLNPDLFQALRDAATVAAADGITISVTSGWRSAEYQNQLLRGAISAYGSEAEAARWVATADASPHVSGNAVDIGLAEAAAWLSEHGAGFGLCQIYQNEPWHYELHPDAADHRCPAMYADPTYAPRMQP
jgi:hypothetical protein